MCFVLLYTQQRKGLPGNVGKVHNQSSSHSFTPCTQALAVVANVLVILIYTEWSFFTSFASNFAMCSLECLIINAQIGYVNNLCAHTFFFFSQSISTEMLHESYWCNVCVVLNLIPVNLNACKISSIKCFVHLCFDTTTIPFSFSCSPLF